MENFISCRFMGGLGNQLFQAAHVIAQGLKTNRNFFFEPTSATPNQGRTADNYISNIFRNLEFREIIDNFDSINIGNFEYIETHPKDNNTVFSGYFQSSKNFLGFDNEIRKIFSPSDDFIHEIQGKYPEIKYEDTLSIHVRRGDSFYNQDIHPIANEKYFNKAINEIETYSHIFIFSDDKKWVSENLKFENSTYVDEEDYKELWLMSLCKNNIIVNSTFSWWGSFLNTNPQKKVIAPSIWFGPRGPQKYSDVYEPYWKIIKVEYDNGWLI